MDRRFISLLTALALVLGLVYMPIAIPGTAIAAEVMPQPGNPALTHVDYCARQEGNKLVGVISFTVESLEELESVTLHLMCSGGQTNKHNTYYEVDLTDETGTVYGNNPSMDKESSRAVQYKVKETFAGQVYVYEVTSTSSEGTVFIEHDTSHTYRPNRDNIGFFPYCPKVDTENLQSKGSSDVHYLKEAKLSSKPKRYDIELIKKDTFGKPLPGIEFRLEFSKNKKIDDIVAWVEGETGATGSVYFDLSDSKFPNSGNHTVFVYELVPNNVFVQTCDEAGKSAGIVKGDGETWHLVEVVSFKPGKDKTVISLENGVPLGNFGLEKYWDMDFDGTKGEGETAINGVTFYLYFSPDKNEFDFYDIGATVGGSLEFTDLPIGHYRLYEMLQPNACVTGVEGEEFGGEIDAAKDFNLTGELQEVLVGSFEIKITSGESVKLNKLTASNIDAAIGNGRLLPLALLKFRDLDDVDADGYGLFDPEKEEYAVGVPFAFVISREGLDNKLTISGTTDENGLIVIDEEFSHEDIEGFLKFMKPGNIVEIFENPGDPDSYIPITAVTYGAHENATLEDRYSPDSFGFTVTLGEALYNSSRGRYEVNVGNKIEEEQKLGVLAVKKLLDGVDYINQHGTITFSVYGEVDEYGEPVEDTFIDSCSTDDSGVAHFDENKLIDAFGNDAVGKTVYIFEELTEEQKLEIESAELNAYIEAEIVEEYSGEVEYPTYSNVTKSAPVIDLRLIKFLDEKGEGDYNGQYDSDEEYMNAEFSLYINGEKRDWDEEPDTDLLLSTGIYVYHNIPENATVKVYEKLDEYTISGVSYGYDVELDPLGTLAVNEEENSFAFELTAELAAQMLDNDGVTYEVYVGNKPNDDPPTPHNDLRLIKFLDEKGEGDYNGQYDSDEEYMNAEFSLYINGEQRDWDEEPDTDLLLSTGIYVYHNIPENATVKVYEKLDGYTISGVSYGYDVELVPLGTLDFNVDENSFAFELTTELAAQMLDNDGVTYVVYVGNKVVANDPKLVDLEMTKFIDDADEDELPNGKYDDGEDKTTLPRFTLTIDGIVVENNWSADTSTGIYVYADVPLGAEIEIEETEGVNGSIAITGVTYGEDGVIDVDDDGDSFTFTLTADMFDSGEAEDGNLAFAFNVGNKVEPVLEYELRVYKYADNGETRVFNPEADYDTVMSNIVSLNLLSSVHFTYSVASVTPMSTPIGGSLATLSTVEPDQFWTVDGTDEEKEYVKYVSIPVDFYAATVTLTEHMQWKWEGEEFLPDSHYNVIGVAYKHSAGSVFEAAYDVGFNVSLPSDTGDWEYDADNDVYYVELHIGNRVEEYEPVLEDIVLVKFNDENGNGHFDSTPTEEFVRDFNFSVTVNATPTDEDIIWGWNEKTYNNLTTTGEDGSVSFAVPAPGEFDTMTITITEPSGQQDYTRITGVTYGEYGDYQESFLTPDSNNTVVLTFDGDSEDPFGTLMRSAADAYEIRFGNIKDPSVEFTGNLRLTKFFDANRNGTNGDSGDYSLSGIRFLLASEDNGYEMEHTTGSNGVIFLTNLEPGTYTLTELTTGYTMTTDRARLTFTVPENLETAFTYEVEVGNYRGGSYPPPNPPNTGGSTTLTINPGTPAGTSLTFNVNSQPVTITVPVDIPAGVPYAFSFDPATVPLASLPSDIEQDILDMFDDEIPLITIPATGETAQILFFGMLFMASLTMFVRLGRKYGLLGR